MSSRFRDRVVRVAAAIFLTAPLATHAARALRICADPANLPYSSQDQRGFENRIAGLIASDLGAELRYYWLPQCDVIPGIPAAADNVLATDAYYRGTYAFVYSPKRFPHLVSLDDARLRTLRIGLQIVGIDAIATPPGRALARRGIVDNVVGFPVMGDTPSAERIVDALAAGTLDVGIVWSPQPGYFIAQRHAALDVVPIRGGPRDPAFDFPIAMGVREDEPALQQAINASIARLKPQIDAVLREYAVVRVDQAAAQRAMR
jgi:mxaJ protein